MRRPTTENSITDGDWNMQIGTNTGTIVQGISAETFVAEMQRKDAEIKRLVEEKTELLSQVHELEKEKLVAELDALKEKEQALEYRLAAPEKSFADHKSRAEQIESMLSNAATLQALGENRIRSALIAFGDLEYEEIDSLLKETRDRSLIIAAEACYALGLVAEDAIRWAEAAEHYRKAVDLLPDLKNLQKATYFCELSGEYEFSLKYALMMRDLAQEENDFEALSYALDREATVYWRRGDGNKAKDVFSKAVAVYEENIERDDHDYAIRLNNFAIVLSELEEYSKAELYFRKAVEITQKDVGEGHPDYGKFLSNLGVNLRWQEKYVDAENLYQEALKNGLKVIGETHPNFAMVQNNLAVCFLVQNRLKEAEPLLRQAVETTRKTLGTKHPTYALRLANLGSLLCDMGKSTEGRSMLETALETFSLRLPPDHPRIDKLKTKLNNLPPD